MRILVIGASGQLGSELCRLDEDADLPPWREGLRDYLNEHVLPNLLRQTASY